MPKQEPTGWVGWGYFASAMLLLVGGMQVIAGLTALFKDEFYLVGAKGLLVYDYTAWGWTHLIVGVLLFLTGLALLSGKTWAIVLAVGLAILSALANLAFLPAYPLWALIAITIDVFVIYALTRHGAELKDE